MNRRRPFQIFWASPNTLLGILFAICALLSGGTLRVHQGVLEVRGGWINRFLHGGRFRTGGAAMTLGHVILARDQQCLEDCREHEQMHVRQYECWGPFFLPVYFLLALWLKVRGYHPYLDHPFEQNPDVEVETSAPERPTE